MKKSKIDKNCFQFLFLLLIIVVFPLFLMKEYRIIKAKKNIQVSQSHTPFRFKLLETQDKQFTLIVLTKNNITMIDENVESILKQKYPHYQVVYIDQASVDGTAHRLEELISQSTCKNKMKLLKAENDHKAVRFYFDEIHALDDNRVVIHLSGNDFLARSDALDLVNQAYKNPDVWMTYGQYLDYYNYQKGIYQPKPHKLICKKRIQKAPWTWAPLKTFYAGHFKRIKKRGPIENDFFAFETEGFLLLPLAELGKAHIQFIPSVLYIRGLDQQAQSRKIKLFFKPKQITKSVRKAFSKSTCGVDIILFSENRPRNLHHCLTSIHHQLEGVQQIFAIYSCDENSTNIAAYDQIKIDYPHVELIKQNASNFKSLFFQALANSASPYVILSSDHMMINEHIDVPACIEAMQKSGAYGFYFHLGREIHDQSEGIFSYLIDRARDSWREPNVLKMALYRKVDLERDFEQVDFNSIAEWIKLWSLKDAHHFGLVFQRPKSTPSADISD